MALIRWDVFSKFKQGKQVINHLWIAKGIGADNELYVLEVNPATGGLPITFSGDTNWGVVGAGTLRTAAQIGNAAGPADFDAGVTGAQTLRTASNIYGSGGEVLDMDAGTTGPNTLRVVLALGGAGISFNADKDWGVVGANTLRTASVTGNQIGVADFNAGAVSAQTLRTTLDSNLVTQITGTNTATTQMALAVGTIGSSPVDAMQMGVIQAGSLVPLTLGQVTMSASVPVAIASNQTALPVTQSGTWGVGVTNLPTTVAVNDGASNASTLRVSANLNYGGTPATVDFGVTTNALRTAALLGNPTGLVAYGTGADSAQTLRATLSTRAEAAATPLATRAGNGTNFADFAAGATGAATPRVSANIMRDGNALDYNAGAASANTLRVVSATGGAPTTFQSGAYVTSTRTDFSSVTLSLSTWTQLVASTSAIINNLTIFMSSGVTLELATGAAASETRVLLIPPGGFDAVVPLFIAASTRISVRAVDTVPSVGFLTMNYIA